MNHTHTNHLSTILPPWSGRLGNCLTRLLPVGTMLLLLSATLSANAQTLTNGGFHDGTVLLNQTNSSNFSATNGDRIVMRRAQLSTTNNFAVWMRVYDPNGVLLDSGPVGGVDEYAFTAATNGTYTVLISDGSAAKIGTGTFRIYFVKLPGAFTIPPGDDGGPLPGSGGFQDGTIGSLGDMDLWTFPATNGERIVLRRAQSSTTNNFAAWMRLYDPNGVLLDSGPVGGVDEYAFTAATNGTYTLLLTDGSGNKVGTGTYRIYLVKLPGAFTIPPGDDGGQLPGSGEFQDGAIGSLGDMDLWTFPATNGERIVMRRAQLSTTNNFAVWMRVYDPNGVLLDSGPVGGVDEYAFTATTNGTYTLLLTDGSGNTVGTGTYRIYLVKLPGAFTIPPGDDGGPLPGSGGFQDGTIGSLGDMDLWTFPATNGDRIVLRRAQLGTTNNFAVWMRLYDPNGVLLDSGPVGGVDEYAFTATTNNTYTLLMTDGSGNRGGTGTYRIYFVKLPGAYIVPIGDDGGLLANGAIVGGAIELGDIDVWSFNACAGDSFTLQLDELTGGSSFLLQMRLYGRDGTLLNTASDQTSAQIGRVAPAAGTYTVLVNDASGSLNGTGTYQLTGAGVLSGITLCRPVVSGTNVILSGVGGLAGTNFNLLTHTNVATPAALWTPIWTNQFDSFGTFTRTNPFNSAELQRYFRLRTP